MGILFVGSHVAPVVGAANPIAETGKFIGKQIIKIIEHGEIKKAHIAIEKAFQKFKEQPLKYGIENIGAVST